MCVERLEVVPYALPFKEPYVTARGRLDRRELVLVRLYADGLVGLGFVRQHGNGAEDQLMIDARELRGVEYLANVQPGIGVAEQCAQRVFLGGD